MIDGESTIQNCPFLFKCDKKWEDMSLVEVSSNGGEVRYCSGCKKKVHHCTSVVQFLEHQKLNNCIMLDISNVHRTLGVPAKKGDILEYIPFSKSRNHEKK